MRKYQFPGIQPEAFNLLAENRFRNSKDFYDAHKEELKELARKPLMMLAMDAIERVQEFDPDVYFQPNYMVSRIRRDTRYTKDKTLYRENVWMSFKRHRSMGDATPCIWFEYYPGSYTAGVGYLAQTPAFMEFFRKQLLEDPQKFLDAVKPLEAAGFKDMGDAYKRPKSLDVPEELKAIYNKKEIFYMRSSTRLQDLMKPSFANQFMKWIDLMEPLYKYLLELQTTFRQEETYGNV